MTPEEWQAIALSLRVAFVATCCALPPGIWIAHVLARREFRGKWLIDGLVHLPLVLPPVVTGYLLLMAFGRQGVIGRLLDDWFGLSFAFNWTGAALASAVMGFPLMVRAIRLGFEAIDSRIARTISGKPITALARAAPVQLNAKLRPNQSSSNRPITPCRPKAMSNR